MNHLIIFNVIWKEKRWLWYWQNSILNPCILMSHPPFTVESTIIPYMMKLNILLLTPISFSGGLPFIRFISSFHFLLGLLDRVEEDGNFLTNRLLCCLTEGGLWDISKWNVNGSSSSWSWPRNHASSCYREGQANGVASLRMSEALTRENTIRPEMGRISPIGHSKRRFIITFQKSTRPGVLYVVVPCFVNVEGRSGYGGANWDAYSRNAFIGN